MTARTIRLVLVLAAAGGLVACGSSVPAGIGEACGPNRGCAEGLTCTSGTCTSVGGNDGGTVTDGGNAGDGGTVTDGGNTGDGGTVTDGGTSDGGTTDGGTTDGGTACGPCDTPPDVCHATQGTCENGACVYAVVDGASCDDGNPCTVQDTCSGGTCAGTPMVCNTPPAPACISGTQLSTYDQTGVCSGGRCTYTKKTITCGSGGCVNNACQTDPCATMTCNTPPSTCYTSAGTCSNGSCTYPYADGTTCNDNDPCTTGDTCNTGVCKGQPMACNNPPPSTCTGANTAKIYAPAGVCSLGQCSYTYSYVTCASGCANGACKASGWTNMVSNTNVDLFGIWGTSATNVWAVGGGGAVVHWNGTQWQVQSSGSQYNLGGISGTSSSDIVVVAAPWPDMDVLHYDGTGWSSEATSIPLSPSNVIPTMTVGADDTIFAGSYKDASGYYHPQIDEVHAGTVSILGTATGYGSAGGLWAFSSSDVYLAADYLYHYDGTSLTKVTTPISPTITAIWAAGPNAIFINGGGNVQYYDGTSWHLLNTGLSGTISAIGGTAANRVFALATSGGGSATNTVLMYDGTGWTRASTPAGTGSLNAIWAAPDGEVFAVGYGGTIIHGP